MLCYQETKTYTSLLLSKSPDVDMDSCLVFGQKFKKRGEEGTPLIRNAQLLSPSSYSHGIEFIDAIFTQCVLCNILRKNL
jgi:hypothetical protein